MAGTFELNKCSGIAMAQYLNHTKRLRLPRIDPSASEGADASSPVIVRHKNRNGPQPVPLAWERRPVAAKTRPGHVVICVRKYCPVSLEPRAVADVVCLLFQRHIADWSLNLLK